ncbi:MAG: 23S rRNA (adenine(2503)-C(2))-methyltransferase RlmN [Candidatus Dojkabacteria bacterium]|jgi:23S rRNA (adenine2503-C2)-methyltransferase|nr:23S rRNA (adenine(2503)-C(2))-methyltransferase RlmN [Candidatus Dojkabacteria bacterium]
MFKTFVKKHNLPTYRISQINSHYYKDFVSSWDEMSTLPKDLREQLKEEIPFSKLIYISSNTSKDGNTQKVLFKTEKGNHIESVLMKEKGRNTVCVSCMSGCPVGCIFCATGQMGLNENLDSQQILDQILYFCRILKSQNERVTNIVYMGMGEPLLNLENVSLSIIAITAKDMLAFSKRRVTLSTSGYVQNLRTFLAKNLGVKIAISLHAPNQKLRNMLMPTVSNSNSLKDLLETLDSYTKKSNKRITYEYVLLRNINDSVEHAKELANLLKDRLALVNLINYNENECLPFKKSKNTPLFQRILQERGITCTIRKSLGEDIKGACGQLAS